jgi:hypothetical protein
MTQNGVMSHLPAYLVGALVAYFTSVGVDILVNRDRYAKSDRHSWQRIVPGAKHWISLAGLLFLTATLFCLRTIVGSAREDAAHQLQVMNGMVLFMAACSIGCLWQIRRIHRANVCFRYSMLSYSNRAGIERLRPMTEVAAISQDAPGKLIIMFVDDESLTLDPDAKGITELCFMIDATKFHYLTA